MRERGESKISLLIGELVLLSACGVFLMINLMVAGFCSIKWLMILWVMGVGFENTCTVSEKWNVSRFIWRLYKWDYNMLTVPLIIAEDVQWLWLPITDLGDFSSSIFAGSQFSFSALPESFWSKLRTSTLEVQLHLLLGRKTYLLSVLILRSLCENPVWGAGRKNYFVNFFLWGYF